MEGYKLALTVMALNELQRNCDQHGQRRQLTPAELDALVDVGWRQLPALQCRSQFRCSSLSAITVRACIPPWSPPLSRHREGEHTQAPAKIGASARLAWHSDETRPE